MPRQLAHSRWAFYLGLMLMLAPGILSAVCGLGWGSGVVVLILAGGLLSLTARLWHQRLIRSIRHATRPFHAAQSRSVWSRLASE